MSAPVAGGGVELLSVAHERRAEAIRANCKPSARKSFGSYKPLIIHNPGPWQRTEVVGSRAETRYRVSDGHNHDVRTAYTHYERGVTFPERADAIEYAAKVIERRIAAALADADKAREREAYRASLEPSA